MSQMPYGPLPQSLPPWTPPKDPGPARIPSRFTAAVSVLAVVAVLALGFAVAAWLRAAPKTEAGRAGQVHSGQQADSARAAVCSAQGEVRQALTAATHQPEATEPGNTLLIAVNIRLAEYAGADYLSQRLADNPAAPTAVTEPVRDLVYALRRLAIAQLGDAPADTLQPITDQIGTLTDEVAKACLGHT